MGEPDLAVAIVSWNVRDLLVACLESVYTALEAAGLHGTVWVVDNASQDGSAGAIRARFDHVRLIPSPINLWFGGGQNLALRAMGFDTVPVPAPAEVTGDRLTIRGGAQEGLHLALAGLRALPRYVLILNPDTLVRENALAEMVRFMDEHPRAGCCGPRLVYGDGRFQHAAYRFPSLAQTLLDFWPVNWRLGESSLNGRYPRSLYERGEPFPIDHPLGAAMLFRRQAIEQSGGFDLAYRMYVEEIDWCWRVKRCGWEIYCVPRVEVVHHEGQSTRQVRPEMIVALWRSRYLFFARYHSSLYRWLIKRVVRAGARAQIRRTLAALRRGEIDEPAAQALVGAYRQVIAIE